MTILYRDQVIPPTNGAGRPSLVREYLNTEPRKLLYSVGFIIGVMAVVTVPYVLIVGFDKWSSDMKEAGHMMWAGYTPTAGAAVAAGAAPNGGNWAVPGQLPGNGLWLAGPAAGSYAVVPTAAAQPLAPAPMVAAPQPGSGRQYVCPGCGAVGLPTWTTAGQPLCPICGGGMFVAPMRFGLELAAAP